MMWFLPRIRVSLGLKRRRESWTLSLLIVVS